MLLLATVGAHEYLQYAASVRNKSTEKFLGPSWQTQNLLKASQILPLSHLDPWLSSIGPRPQLSPSALITTDRIAEGMDSTGCHSWAFKVASFSQCSSSVQL